MKVVDASGWLEYFANGVNADFFVPILEKPAELIVPVSTLDISERVAQVSQVNDSAKT